ncbi:hypothetical protein CAEBREN_09777 [Caenorhabditis brenneri]|uniref:Uncharacterized protein n=1 Tax=Caenorhabditis brenneri TaxID=135651 RepID=G0MYH1_CAEBE|nr:hypothetical protein CAEBREN_09777 [Caenorhabditis brenneri]
MLPETMRRDETCAVPMSLTNEVMKAFGTVRARTNRSASRESCKSRTSEIETENDDEGFKEMVLPVIIPHPSPEYEPEDDETSADEKYKVHAFDLSVQLEVASTFGRVSSLSFHSDYASELVARSISSFGENNTADLHFHPKIRRSSSPGVTLFKQNPSRRASLMIPYQRENSGKHTSKNCYL